MPLSRAAGSQPGISTPGAAADHIQSIRLDCGYRLDLLIEDQLILELKSVESLLPIHEAQVLTYMKLSGLRTGLLLNFNSTVLKNGIRRLML